jgi:hypothetical protein
MLRGALFGRQRQIGGGRFGLVSSFYIRFVIPDGLVGSSGHVQRIIGS